jgi:hypothetical protein
VVSNRGVRRAILSLVFLLPSFGAWAQGPSTDKTQADAIQHGRESATCIQADIVLKDDRAVTVMVSLGTLKRGQVDVPTVHDVKVTYPSGTIHRLDRLGDLPVELHRPLPKGPKDLPSPVPAQVLFSVHGDHAA